MLVSSARSAATSPDQVPFVSVMRSEEHTSELQSLRHLVCRLLLEKKKKKKKLYELSKRLIKLLEQRQNEYPSSGWYAVAQNFRVSNKKRVETQALHTESSTIISVI